MDGQALTFHLAGINNQNFIMRDEQTGSWWQQVSGEAIRGPMRGRRLRPMIHEELTFATWKAENPGGRVLRPDPAILAADHYAPADWEEKTAKRPVVTPANDDDALKPRELIIGIAIGSASRAYPHEAIRKQRILIDELGGVPVAIVLADDGRSVRAFDRRVNGRTLEFLALTESSSLRLVDAETGSTWDFTGIAISGPLFGQPLKRIPVLRDYWFDWKTYHPGTSVYSRGGT